MIRLQYYSHILLTNRFSFIIKLLIFVSIYMLFYLKNINNISYCTEDFYIYWPTDSDNIIDKDVEYYALKDDYSRRLLSQHRENVSLQKGYFNYFVDAEYQYYRFHAYNEVLGSSFRHQNFFPLDHTHPRVFSANLEDFLTRNKKPFVELDYSDLKINKQTIIDNRGKMIREVSTNTPPCDCFSMTKRYIDVYYPSYHPDNGFKPHSEVNRHLVETRPGCNIS